MIKAIIRMIIILAVLFTLIFGYKMFAGYKAGKAMSANKSPAVTVSSFKVIYQEWRPKLKAVASLRAVRGVNVTTELAGMVRKIRFVPGTDVKEGDLLVELNIDQDVALLDSLMAQAKLAQIVYKRDKAQFAVQAVSQATLDTDIANLESNQAQVAEQAAVVGKKIIRAPFTGRLGISQINPGQYLNPGDTIVNLQALDPIYADFYLPQQDLAQLAIGQSVFLTTDTYPNQSFTGKITTIEPMVDTATRNVKVEATLDNPKYQLMPGMFAPVEVFAGKAEQFLTVPQTAISFNPYGDLIYVINQTAKSSQGQRKLTVQQRFVTVGKTRGDQVAVLSGLKEGETIVTAGQMKLKNGDAVVINNQVLPSNNPAPPVMDN